MQNQNPAAARSMLRAVFSFVLLMMATLAIDLHILPWQTYDPDYFFHVALSRESELLHPPHSVPQISGIGWDKQFVDKEFMFHRLTTVAYRVGGERALSYLPLLLGTLTCALLWLGMRGRRSGYFWAAAAVLPALLSFHFRNRSTLLRPHDLAIPLAVALWLALRSRRLWLIALASAAFSLSYHAIQIPLLILFAYGISSESRSSANLRPITAAIAGLGLGLLVNPYFPETLYITIQVIQLSLDVVGKSSLPYGQELYPWAASQLLMLNVLPIAVLLIAIQAKEYASFATLSTAAFAALSFLSPRALEYMIPFSALLLGHLIVERKLEDSKIRAFLALAIAAQAAQLYKPLTSVPDYSERPRSSIAASRALPPEAKGKLVYNCSWDISPYLYYARPDVRFVDLLDPSFLYTASRPAYDARMQMEDGIVPDTYGLLRNAFEADYVLCDHTPLNTQLDADPRFARLYPKEAKPDGGGTYLFALKGRESQSQRFVEAYSAARAQPVMGQLDALVPQDVRDWRDSPSNANSLPYLDLLKWYPATAPARSSSASGSDATDSALTCHWITPTPEQTRMHAGAEYVGLGGGPSLRLWLNGRELYQSAVETATPRLIDVLVPLPRKLRAEDRLVALDCAKNRDRYLGISMSFWTGEQVDGFCDERANPYRLNTLSRARWPYVGKARITCLAPVAASH